MGCLRSDPDELTVYMSHVLPHRSNTILPLPGETAEITSEDGDPVTFSNPDSETFPSPVAVPAARSTFTPFDELAKLTVSVPPRPARVSAPPPPSIVLSASSPRSVSE